MESFVVLKFIFLEKGERPVEAPASSLEKKILNSELATDSWKRRITIFIIEKRALQMKHLLNLFV